jgi:anti-anti-sigma factor
MFAHSPIPSLAVHRAPDRTVLSIAGCEALDEDNSPLLGQRLSGLPEAASGECLLLDLGGIRHVSSMGFGALLALDRRVRSAGGRFALANAGPAVKEALALTRLDTLLEVLPDESNSSHAKALLTWQRADDDERPRRKSGCRGGPTTGLTTGSTP